MKLQINTDVLPGYSAGQVITLKVKSGVPVDKYWRNRLADSAIDDCVSVVDKTRKSKEAS